LPGTKGRVMSLSAPHDMNQPRLVSLTPEQLKSLQSMLGFAGSAAVLVWPPPPEMAVLQEVRETMKSMAGDLKAVARNQYELHKENGELRDGKAALAAMHVEWSCDVGME
jgi:hypothetical protein